MASCKATNDSANRHANLVDNHQKISVVNQIGATLHKALSQRESQSTSSVYFSYIKITRLLVNPNSFLF
ncbi:MAG TPA: hypothetical protein DD666_21345 [Advenella kashmirensis]|uniref:Uncharacterized protein n=1 Tax=Advenella kashmirensis TaxID=310575 RepID=A0A356LMX1_9BURK|nr:hypothetical protein [Advenella kashmirensis]